MVGVSCRSGRLVSREHDDVGQVEPGLLDRGIPSPRLLEHGLDGLASNEVAVVEAEEGSLIDHLFEKAEVLLHGHLLEVI